MTSIQPTSHHPESLSSPAPGNTIHVDLYLQQRVGGVWVTIEEDRLEIGTHENSTLLTSGGGGSGSDDPSISLVWELPATDPVFRLNITTNSEEPVPVGLQIIQHSEIYRYKVYSFCTFLLASLNLVIIRCYWVR
jgi:hypothetical protein